MCLVGVINYWLLIPTGIMTILFYIIQSVYVHTARSLKRIEALSMYLIFTRHCILIILINEIYDVLQVAAPSIHI